MKNNTITNCLICEKQTKLIHENFPGYQDGMLFNIHYCDSCITSFPMPRIETDKIYEAIYKNGEKVPGYNRYWEYFKTIKNQSNPLQYLANSEEAYWGIKTALEQLKEDKSKLKVLELGSGLGYLTYALRKENYNAVGIEISQEAVNQANNHFGKYYLCEDLFEYSKTNKETFDIVILTEVIEHIESPISFIEAIKELITPEGKIILTTPNRTLIPSNIIWATDLPPVHYWWFSEKSMNIIAKKLNLDISFIDFSKYYNHHPRVFRVKRKSKNRLPTPILSKDLTLLRQTKNHKKMSFRAFIKSFPIIKKTFLKLNKAFGSKNIVYSKKGECLCAIFYKN